MWWILPSPHAVPVRVALPRRVRRSPAYAGSPHSPCRRARAPRAGIALSRPDHTLQTKSETLVFHIIEFPPFFETQGVIDCPSA